MPSLESRLPETEVIMRPEAISEYGKRTLMAYNDLTFCHKAKILWNPILYWNLNETHKPGGHRPYNCPLAGIRHS